MKCIQIMLITVLMTGSNWVLAKAGQTHQPGVSDQRWSSLQAAVQEAKLLPSPNGIGGDSSQFSESISVSGDRALIGAPNTLGSGTAVLLQYDGIEWVEVAVLQPGDGQQDDFFGHAVSLVGDRALIGAYSNDVAAANAGAVYVFEFDGHDWLETQKLTASDGALNDHFGRAVSLSNDRALIGSPQDDDQGTESGSVYVFDFDGNDWHESHKLTASDGASNDLFGWSISLHADRALIGAHQDDDLGNASGAVFVYDFDGVNWHESTKLLASDGQAEDGFGYALSLSADRLVVGAIKGDGLEADSGSAYLFDHDGTTWIETQKLFASDGKTDDFFARAVSMSGNRVLIGAHNNHNPGPDAGAAYVFEHDGLSWSESQKLKASDGSSNDWFGYSVGLSDNQLLVGALKDHTTNWFTGSAYAFDFDGSQWTESQKLTASEGAGNDYFGHAVSIDGNRALVGAYSDNEIADYSGAAYVFDFDGIAWIETQKLTASDGHVIKNFGHSVSLNGDRALIGATDSAHVFEFNGNSWTETHKLTASDGMTGGSGDWFGHSVSLFDHWALIGAYRDDDLGTNSGSAYLFRYDGVQWLETQKITASDASSFNYFARHVSLFGDRLLVGAPQAFYGGPTGAAYVFDYDGSTWSETQRLVASDANNGDLFGGSVSLEEDRALIGAQSDVHPGGGSGSAYVFDFNGIDWVQTQKLVAADFQTTGGFGYSVSLSGNRALMGSILDHDNGLFSGAAYLFELADANWIEDQKITASDGQAYDRFGSAVSLSGDLLLIGAEFDDDHGGDAGAAYVYDLIPEYDINVSVVGLAATNAVSFSNASDQLTVTTNGTATLSRLNDGSVFDVDITAQPTSPNQVCQFTNADSGVLNGSHVTVTIVCTTSQYHVGGTLSGLAAGNAVVMQNLAGDDLTVAANGPFTFPTPLDDGSNYAVTILTQPFEPNQTCQVYQQSGQLAGADVTDIKVECATTQYAIGGTVVGLVSDNSVTLSINDGAETLVVDASGAFEFVHPLADGSDFVIAVDNNPTSPNQTCTVNNGEGTVTGGPVNNVVVDCQLLQYAIGGQVVGLLPGNQLRLQNNQADDLMILTDGPFQFPVLLDDGQTYAVTIESQPANPVQTCLASQATGQLSGLDVDNVLITCETGNDLIYRHGFDN